MAAEPNLGLIDERLLDAVCAEARASPRRRKNHNFHAGNDHPAHRLLNAMEADSYIPPHCHLDALKDETMLVLRGRLGLMLFDAAGTVTGTKVLGSGGDALGVTLASGVWHTVVALESGTVFFESKAGPYLPLTAAERALWAPAENDAAAPAYLERLRGWFPH